MNETTETLILVPVLNGLGKLLKANHKVPDEWIPTILCLVGSLIMCAASGTWTLEMGKNGFVAAALAITANQIWKQHTTNGKTNETKPSPAVPAAPVAPSGTPGAP